MKITEEMAKEFEKAVGDKVVIHIEHKFNHEKRTIDLLHIDIPESPEVLGAVLMMAASQNDILREALIKVLALAMLLEYSVDGQE